MVLFAAIAEIEEGTSFSSLPQWYRPLGCALDSYECWNLGVRLELTPLVPGFRGIPRAICLAATVPLVAAGLHPYNAAFEVAYAETWGL